MKNTFLSLAFVISVSMAFAQSTKSLPYKDAKLTPEVRAKDLLSRMSLEDKIPQLIAVWDSKSTRFNAAFFADTAKVRSVLGKGVESVQPFFCGIKETVESRNAIQKYLTEKTKWGIPALFVDEGQHGLMKPEATSFPMAIGLACGILLCSNRFTRWWLTKCGHVAVIMCFHR